MSIVKSPRKPSGVHYTTDPVARVYKKLHRSMTRTTSFASARIIVEVGDKKQKFFVHEALLSANSDFFKTALKPEWKNNTTRSIALPEADPVAFQIYLDWLYSGPHITIIKKEDRVKSTPNATPSVDHEWTKWAACYDLGSFLQDIDFKDALIDAAMEKMYTEEGFHRFAFVHLPSFHPRVSTPEACCRHRCKRLDSHVLRSRYQEEPAR